METRTRRSQAREEQIEMFRKGNPPHYVKRLYTLSKNQSLPAEKREEAKRLADAGYQKWLESSYGR